MSNTLYMRVLIVNRYMSLYGGAETVVKELATNLNLLGIKNLVLTLNISEEVRRICGSLDIITPPEFFPYAFRSTDFFSSLGIIKEIRALRYLVKKYAADFDLINVHNFPADWVVWGLGKPVVWMCNEIPDFYYNPHPSFLVKLLRAVGIRVDTFIVSSLIDTICVADEYTAQHVSKRYRRTPCIVPYGIEHEFFSQSGDTARVLKHYKLNEDDFLLLQVGVLSPEKNQLKSIQAVEQLKGQIPNLILILAGKDTSPYGLRLKEYVQRNNLQTKVIFTGHLSKNEVRDLYQACKIALFPVKSQGGWLAPFEALGQAKPIIVSPTMGAAALIKRQHLGLVTDELVNTVIEVYNNLKYYEEMAQKASLWVKDNLTWETFTQRMVDIFSETLDSRRRK